MGVGGITISGGSISLPYINPNPNNPIQGMIRVSGSDFQVFDGHAWQQLATGHPSVSLDQETQNLLSWAKSKQRQEIELLEMATKNEAVRIALENVKKAQDNLTITAHLSRDYETTS